MTTIGSGRLVALPVGLCGMTPVIASDGAAVLEQLSAHGISLVLTDDGMPSCNGLELMTRIHAPDATIPVTIVSGEERSPSSKKPKGAAYSAGSKNRSILAGRRWS